MRRIIAACYFEVVVVNNPRFQSTHPALAVPRDDSKGWRHRSRIERKFDIVDDRRMTSGFVANKCSVGTVGADDGLPRRSPRRYIAPCASDFDGFCAQIYTRVIGHTPGI